MITVSIVTYKHTIKQLEKLILSIINTEIVSKLFIIDNSPTNVLESQINYEKVNYIFLNKNIGYGSGHNLVINKVIDDINKYHLVVNPDVNFESGILDKLIEYMEVNNDIGLLTPKIEYPDGQTQYLCKLLASPLDLIGRRFIPFKKFTNRMSYKYELRFSEYNKVMQVPSLSGCFMLLRTEILKKTGGFDERFFMYCEDLDLSRRIGEFSKTVFYPEVSVIHSYEKGSYKNLKLLKCHIISAIKYFNKWGWFFDKDRRTINRETLLRLGYKK